MDMITICLSAWGLVILSVGFFLQQIENTTFSRLLSWAIAVITVFLVVLITDDQSSLYRMIATVSLLLLSMKVIVLNESCTHNKPQLKFYQWSGFALGWFGMRPVLFEKLISKSLPDRSIFVKGISSIMSGLVFLYLSSVLDSHFQHPHLLSDLLMLMGLSLILHFGILNLSTSFWRALGVDVTELFQSPYKARSLKEFWGKRWNIAFSEMTSLAIYRPLKNRYGKQLSMFAAFLFSGLLHEIAISVPVNAGHGLPFLYFSLHAVAMYAETNWTLIKSILSNKMLSRIWVLICVILPSPLLFHSQFRSEVLRPFRDIIISVF